MKNEKIEKNLNIFEEAIAFAVEKHASQKRKGSSWPYLVHLYEVTQILQENNANQETVMAGILHDTVEDTNTTLNELASKFGYHIASLVDILSENKTLPYKERKKLQAERIKLASQDAKMVKCADCLSNLRSICFDEKTDINVWSKFNSTKENIQEHYLDTITALSDLEKMEMYQELKKYYQKVFDKEKPRIAETVQQSEQKETNNNEKKKKFEKFINRLSNESPNEPKTTIKTTNPKPYVLVGKQKISDCTECMFMERIRTPDPDDWFCDDDQTFVCQQLHRDLSYANRPYENQPIPTDCPFREK